MKIAAALLVVAVNGDFILTDPRQQFDHCHMTGR